MLFCFRVWQNFDRLSDMGAHRERQGETLSPLRKEIVVPLAVHTHIHYVYTKIIL